jgi:hypothetical protein
VGFGLELMGIFLDDENPFLFCEFPSRIEGLLSYNRAELMALTVCMTFVTSAVVEFVLVSDGVTLRQKC